MSCDTPVVFLLPATLFPRSLQRCLLSASSPSHVACSESPPDSPPHLGSGHSDHIPSRLSSPSETAIFWIMVRLPHWNACPPKSGNSPWLVHCFIPLTWTGPGTWKVHKSTYYVKKWVGLEWESGCFFLGPLPGTPCVALSGKTGARQGMLLARPHWGWKCGRRKKGRGRERRGKKKVSVALEALAVDRNGSDTSDPCLGGRVARFNK